MAKQSNDGFNFEIKEHLGTIKKTKNDWTLEVNMVSFNGWRPGYDIREWSPDHRYMGKGFNFNEDEASTVAALIADHYIKNHSEQFGNGQWSPQNIVEQPKVKPHVGKSKKKEADIVPFRTTRRVPDYSELTPYQKAKVDAGLNTVEDFEMIGSTDPKPAPVKPEIKKPKHTKQISGITVPADIELPF